MIELIVDNSYSQIKGATPAQFNALRNLLSYEPDEAASFFGGFKGSGRKFLLDRKGFFPTGLLEMAASFIIDKNYDVVVRDSREKPIRSLSFKTNLKGIQPYKSQLEALNAANLHGRGTCSLPTGTGKSLIIALLIREFKMKTLVVVPTLSIKIQLSEFLRNTFGDNKNIVVENIDSKRLLTLTDFDMLIVDEAHHGASATYHRLNKGPWKGIYHRFFMTATPFRNVEAEQMLLKAITGEIIYSLSYKEAVKAKQIVPVEGFYVESPKQPTNAVTYVQVYSELVVNNQARNELISEILLNFDAIDKATLCLVKEIKHGRILSEMTGFPFVCGEDAESKSFIDDFNSGRIKTLIGTYGVLGEGVDTKPAEMILVAGLGKAKSAFMQQVGRGVRRFEEKDSAKIILIKDRSQKYLLRHFNIQCKLLETEYDTVVAKIEV